MPSSLSAGFRVPIRRSKCLRTYNKIFIVLWLLILVMSSGHARTSLDVMEKRMNEIQQLIHINNRSILDNMKKSDSLAVRAAQLKERENLSFFNKIKLDNLLKELQRLNSVQENLLLQQHNLASESSELFQLLDERYSAAIDSLVDRIAHGSTNAVIKKQRIDFIGVLKQKQRRLRDEASVALPQNVLNVNPHIASNDMPEDIEAKADFYRDRRDKYMAKAQELEIRIKKVKEENKLRRRMAEMIDDVRLFDQRDESLPHGSAAGNPAPAANGSTKDNGEGLYQNYDGMSGIANTTILQQADQFLKYDYRLLPAYDMEEFLNKLQIERRKILSAADSLSTVIKACEEQAIELRRSIDQPE